jgi:methylated-DNA-[protein]-cysteine S-methyltransferase
MLIFPTRSERAHVTARKRRTESLERSVTPFQQRVYEALCRIPTGRVTTYALLARHLACRSAQAVGQALRRNPFAPRVPCHRVIAADLTLGGFCGKRGGAAIRRKRALLAAEGVAFDAAGRLVEPQRLFRF